MNLVYSSPELRSDSIAAAGSLGVDSSVPLIIQYASDCRSPQPITVGLPLPRGFLRQANGVALRDAAGGPVLVQTGVMARWPDGSVKWLLADFVAEGLLEGANKWSLAATGHRPKSTLLQVTVENSGQLALVNSGDKSYRWHKSLGLAVVADGQEMLDAFDLVLTDRKGSRLTAKIDSAEFETRGPVRVTLVLNGSFRNGLRIESRYCFFAGTGLVRVRVTLHNPRPARHRGGLWDLGDAGSVLFRELALMLRLKKHGNLQTSWRAEAGQPMRAANGTWEVYQDSSGGENWRSPNHVNRDGIVPCSFRGYRVRNAQEEEFGRRATPLVCLQGEGRCLTAAMPEFWQQFPKAIQVEGETLRLGLFPGQHGELFELQGGEQKSHTVWLHFGPRTEFNDSLDWVYSPARSGATPGWYVHSGVLPHLASAVEAPQSRFDEYLAEILEGKNNLVARREGIDEYGWRHYGEIYADHEAEHYAGTAPHISHYNNQYDFLGGVICQFLRSGDTRWFDIFEPLARHVIDIDIYHTDKDRAAYNGGLFWFTDHYKTAATATHRTYSRANCTVRDDSYGGGPSSNHNFSTGLLLYHYLTGDPNARAAVLSLADWVVNMDDGRETVFRLIDDGPTGLATYTGTPDYHGPGRGAGNSINCMIDAWLLSEQRAYLDKSEEFIRRCIHPNDVVPARNLLNVEKRWSYTVFLVALDRYLRLKAELRELDFMYAYARASLLRYAEWMVANEKPYFDQLEKLEYPTEAWAGQEFRKANVMRLASAYADDPLRSHLLRRGEELADRAWHDLERFTTRYSARGVALLMAEGPLDAKSRLAPIPQMPRPVQDHGFGVPETFVPPKQRVLDQLRAVRGLGKAVLKLANPMKWFERDCAVK